MANDGKEIGELIGGGLGAAIGMALAESVNRQAAARRKSNLQSWQDYAAELEANIAEWAAYAKRLEDHIALLGSQLVEKHLDLAGMAAVAAGVLNELESNTPWPSTSCHIVRRRLYEREREAHKLHCTDVDPYGKWAKIWRTARYVTGINLGPVAWEVEQERIRARANGSPAQANNLLTSETAEAHLPQSSDLVREIATNDSKKTKAAYAYAAGIRTLSPSADFAEMPVDDFKVYLQSLSIPIEDEDLKGSS